MMLCVCDLVVVLLLIAVTFAAAAASATERASNDEQQEHQHRQLGIPRRKRKGLVSVASVRSFEETYETLVTTLENNPNLRIVAEIDHAAAADSVGLELLPNRVVVFGNPMLGTPVMQHRPEAGLDLPQKMLVWETADGQVFVGYNFPAYVLARYKGNPKKVPTLDTITGALKSIAAGAAGVDAAMVDDEIRDRDLRRARGRWHKLRSKDDDFEATFERLLGAIETSPANIAFVVDHAFNAPNDELNPARLVVFGNPNLGTPLMQKAATAGIDLPLKILVTQNAKGRVLVYTNSIKFLTWRHRLGKQIDLSGVATAIANFVSAATMPDE